MTDRPDPPAAEVDPHGSPASDTEVPEISRTNHDEGWALDPQMQAILDDALQACVGTGVRRGRRKSLPPRVHAALYQLYANGATIRFLSSSFGIKYRTVQRVIHRERSRAAAEHSPTSSHAAVTRKGRPKLFTHQEELSIVDFCKQNPLMPLREVQKKLHLMFSDRPCALSTLHNILKKYNYERLGNESSQLDDGRATVVASSSAGADSSVSAHETGIESGANCQVPSEDFRSQLRQDQPPSPFPPPHPEPRRHLDDHSHGHEREQHPDHHHLHQEQQDHQGQQQQLHHHHHQQQQQLQQLQQLQQQHHHHHLPQEHQSQQVPCESDSEDSGIGTGTSLATMHMDEQTDQVRRLLLPAQDLASAFSSFTAGNSNFHLLSESPSRGTSHTLGSPDRGFLTTAPHLSTTFPASDSNGLGSISSFNLLPNIDADAILAMFTQSNNLNLFPSSSNNPNGLS